MSASAASSSERIKVHNADLYMEILQSADWSMSPNCMEPTEAMRKLLDARQVAASQPGSHKGGDKPGSPARQRTLPAITSMSKRRVEEELAATERSNRQRDTFFHKQKIREEEVRVRLDQSMKETQKRARERAIMKEAEFEERCANFCEANSHIIDEIQAVVNEEESWKLRKRERLFAEWTAQVFQPMQDRINEQLGSLTHDDIAERRNFMFQCFLDETKRKRGGVFRDIIIESDYDPLTMAKESTIRYSKVPITADPTKNRFTREGGDPTLKALKSMAEETRLREPIVVGGSGSSLLHSTANALSGRGTGGGTIGLGAPREATLPVTLWDHIDVTPYGRFGDEPPSAGAIAKKPNFNKSALQMDHYHVPTGAEGSKLLALEMPSKGKRVFGQHQASAVF